MTKTKHDKYVTNRIGVIYVEIEIEMSWPIVHDVVYHEKNTRQQCDRLY